jgi:ribosomal protein S18 acetylase RimI-like enzyme
MTSSVTVRPAKAADLPALGELGAQLVIEHHEFDPQRFLAPRPNMAQLYGDFLGRQMALPDKTVLAAERDGAVAGYVYAGLEGPDFMALRGPAGVVYDLAVDAAFRRQGIGRMLLEAALHWVAERGAERAVLSTADKNAGAQRLFAQAGFRRTMIEMTRELAPGAGD